MQRLQDPFWQREQLKFDESVIMSEVPKKAVCSHCLLRIPPPTPSTSVGATMCKRVC
jgi:hypothetical protein